VNQRPDLTLFDDPKKVTQWLTQWVSYRVIPIADQEWSEIHAQYADANSYITAVLARPPGEKAYVLTLELGVRWDEQHRATACLTIEWEREPQTLGQLRSVLLDGQPSELKLFARRMTDFEQLPRVQMDVGVSHTE
jgi:hypothetical protein